jgi:hypothetical protein
VPGIILWFLLAISSAAVFSFVFISLIVTIEMVWLIGLGSSILFAVPYVIVPIEGLAVG